MGGSLLPTGSDDPRIVGTNGWAADGGAPLTFVQKLMQVRGASLAYLQELPGEMRWELASRGLAPHKHVKPVGIEPLPQTPAVELAASQLERYAEGETELRNHSFRTFPFAELLHKQAGGRQPLDREVLAVATLLHDVGMYPKAVAEVDGRDFTVRGARIARRVTQEAGWPQSRIDLTAQVITINANGRVPRRWGPEAYFARLAPLVDAVGQCWKVDPDDARTIFSAWPERTLDEVILRAVADEAARHPGSRFALFRPLFPVLVMNCHRRWQQRLAS
jgi:HD domain